MEFKNYWNINETFQEELIYTENIYKIMDAQCKYLLQNTQGKVFAIFDEIKLDGSLFTVAKAMSNVFRSVNGWTNIQENIAEVSTNNLIDASGMYYNKRYAFEICTEKYRFRLFQLKMAPVYPIEMTIDEGIRKNISSKLEQIITSEKDVNNYVIDDEEMFCDILQMVLQDKKVRYIIKELEKRVDDIKLKENNLPEKVILCEGQTDEIILQAIARKFKQNVITVICNGKYNVPVVFDSVREKNMQSNIMIVIDSDGEEEKTKEIINEKLGNGNYELVIINNCIEDWFMPEVADFSKLKLMHSIDTILDRIDIEDLGRKHESFSKVVEFIQK